MPRKLTDSEIQKQGLEVNNELMESGEMRFRLVFGDGGLLARIHAAPAGNWQNSHSHSTLTETYAVQKNFVVFAELIDNQLKLVRYGAGSIFSSHPQIPHNVYLSADSVHYCIKHGDLSKNDWLPSAELDKLTKTLTETELPSNDR